MNDTVIYADFVLPMDDSGTVLHDAAVHIQGRKIAAVLPREQAQHINAHHVVQLKNHILMPGLINVHGHSAMTLLRGYADDLALSDWLNHHIWPAEGQFADGQFVYDGTLLAMAEMIRGGTTTINDMYFFHADVAKAALRMGMRTFVGASILEFPNRYAQNADEYIQHALNTHSAFYGESLVDFVLAPHAPYTVSDETFKKVVQLSDRYGYLIHCHIHETAQEINDSLTQYTMRPIARLNQLGIINECLIAAHAVHTNDEEIALLAQKGVSVAHNPASNMKLASGFAPIQSMIDGHVNVGLGTDGAASNNKLDMFAEIRLAALIAKGYSGNPTALKAYDVLKMATVNAAKALHRESQIGQIKAGFDADLIAIQLNEVETLPLFDPISHLVYAAGREQVNHSWIAGQWVMNNRHLQHIEIDEIRAIAHRWSDKLKR